MEQVQAKVLSKMEPAPGIFKITFFAPQIAKQASPGQFIHVKCGQDRDYILRRPFSIHQSSTIDNVEILFNVKGTGTRWLSKVKVKDTVDIIGPLGSGFNLVEDQSKVMLVAGGMGIAPLVFLASKLVEARAKVSIVIGVVSKDLLFDYMDLKRLSHKIRVSTEDGSQGTKGIVTDILTEAIAADEPTVIYSCGPRPMLREVSLVASEAGIACQVALEELMACGVGVCLSCVTETTEGYKKVCSDGPVFDATKINWDSSPPDNKG